MNNEILLYGNRKEPPMKWDISTPKKRKAAFLKLFKHLKDDWQVYSLDYWGNSQREQKMQRALYKKACAGDGEAAEQLLTMRKSYEYEEFQII